MSEQEFRPEVNSPYHYEVTALGGTQIHFNADDVTQGIGEVLVVESMTRLHYFYDDSATVREGGSWQAEVIGGALAVKHRLLSGGGAVMFGPTAWLSVFPGPVEFPPFEDE